MQPSWFTVPWVQFQSLPTFPTPTLTTLGQMAPPHPPTAVSVGGITPMAAPTPTHTQVNGLSGVTLPLNGLNGLAHGGLVAIPSPPPLAAHAHAHAHPAAHPAHPHPAAALALQQVLRRPAHQPVPAPLAALIRAKKILLCTRTDTCQGRRHCSQTVRQ
ncbi:forkhead box protein L2-like [Portunus trituberculatus]|uniref:forkhead box protein L2-like n=1 Tax=Portunus trituberculatus TaxID=210409 RepID=UPI001E1CE222|nr:forkhead box protein L2-like [Portunus trituberculatus]